MCNHAWMTLFIEFFLLNSWVNQLIFTWALLFVLPLESDVRKKGGSSESITKTSHCNDRIKYFNPTNTQNHRLVHLFNLRVISAFLSLKVHNLDSIVALVEYPACSWFSLNSNLWTGFTMCMMQPGTSDGTFPKTAGIILHTPFEKSPKKVFGKVRQKLLGGWVTRLSIKCTIQICLCATC